MQQDQLRDPSRLAPAGIYDRSRFYQQVIFPRPDMITIEIGHFYLIPGGVIEPSYMFKLRADPLDNQGELTIAIPAEVLVRRLAQLSDPVPAISQMVHVLAEEAGQMSPSTMLAHLPLTLEQRPWDVPAAVFDLQVAIQQHRAISTFLHLATQGEHSLLQYLAEASVTDIDQLQRALDQGRFEETDATLSQLLQP